MRYGDDKARLAFDDGRVLDGEPPRTALKLVAVWHAQHADDLAVA